MQFWNIVAFFLQFMLLCFLGHFFSHFLYLVYLYTVLYNFMR